LIHFNFAFTLWAADLETNIFLSISANAAQGKEKEEKKLLPPAGYSKSTAYTVI
jgi:hypothetical protein